jgi:hypothetical protein
MKTPQQLIGRILTNLIKPESYDLASHIKRLKRVGVKKAIKAVIDDKPIYSPSLPGREQYWRQSFNLPARSGRRSKDAKALRVFTDKKGKVTHHSLDPNSMAMREVAVDAGAKLKLVSDKKLPEVTHTVPNPGYNSLMGGYKLDIDVKKGKAKYSDTWDFAINKGESLKSYLGENRYSKPIKETKVTKFLDKVIQKTETLKSNGKFTNTLNKVTDKLEGVKGLTDLNSNSTKVINKSRKILDKTVTKQKTSGELYAPEGVTKLTSRERSKISKEYNKRSINDKKTQDLATKLLYDKLITKGVMQPFKAAPKPRQVIIKDVQKSKFFNIQNPKQAIKDLKETKYEKRRALNTLAKNKVVKDTTKQHNIAKQNVAILGAQATAATAATGVTANTILSPNKKKKEPK